MLTAEPCNSGIRGMRNYRYFGGYVGASRVMSVQFRHAEISGMYIAKNVARLETEIDVPVSV